MRTGFACTIALISGVAGFRSKHGVHKTIAGIPVHNYEFANEGRAVLLSEDEAANSYKEDWLITVSKDTSNEDIKEMCAQTAACKMVGHPQTGAPVIEIRGTESEVEDALGKVGGVAKTIEPNKKVQLFDPIEEVNAENADPMSLGQSMQSAKAPWNVMRVGKDSAATTGKGVHVYVVDSGVRTTHTDFGGRATTALDMTEGGSRGTLCRGSTSCAMDDNGHGTHCAGIAAGTDYGLAIDAKVYGVKVSFDGESTWSQCIAALDWISTKGNRPAVLSASWGGEGASPALAEAVNGVVNGGIIFITSAGNSGNDACAYTPTMVQAAFTVGATGTRDQKAPFSNWGKCIDIWAPGTNILSTGKSSDTATEKRQGTSMACPLVAGAAALELQSNPKLKPSAVRANILSKALPDLVTDITDDQVNLLLYVGTAEPKPPGFYEPCRRRRRLMCNA